PGERHAGDVRLRLRRQAERRAQRRQQLRAVGRRWAALLPDPEPRAIEPHLERIPEPDEGIAREPLAALDALEEKPRREGTELHERRHRRVEVTGYVEWWLQCELQTKNPSPGSSGRSEERRVGKEGGRRRAECG